MTCNCEAASSNDQEPLTVNNDTGPVQEIVISSKLLSSDR